MKTNSDILENKIKDFQDEETWRNKFLKKKTFFTKNSFILIILTFFYFITALFYSPILLPKSMLLDQNPMFGSIFQIIYVLSSTACIYVLLNYFFNSRHIVNKNRTEKMYFNAEYLEQLDKYQELNRKFCTRKALEEWLIESIDYIIRFCYSSYERGLEAGLLKNDKISFLGTKVVLKLTIDEIFEEYKITKLDELLKYISQLTNDNSGQINIIGFERGSVIVKLEMNRNAFRKFITFFDENLIQELGVTKIDFQSVSDIPESINLLDINGDDKLTKIKLYLKDKISADLSGGFLEVKKHLNVSSDKFNEYLLCRSRFNQLKGKDTAGILNAKDVTHEENKVSMALLTFVDKLTIDDIEKFT